MCVLSCTGKHSLDLRARFRRKIEKNILFCKLHVVFRSICRLGNLFRFKESLEKKILSGIVYGYSCSNCKVTYYGKTFRRFLTRASAFMRTWSQTGKRIRNAEESAIFDDLWPCGYPLNFDDFDILAFDSNKFKLLFKEGLLSKCCNPVLNRKIKQFLLSLLD